MIGFYNRDEKCLLRGTNWVFNKKSSLRFVVKGLNRIGLNQFVRCDIMHMATIITFAVER